MGRDEEVRMDGSLIALGSTLVGLNIIDFKLTWKGVKKLGISREAVPMMEALLNWGYKPTLAFKIIFPSVIAIMLVLRGNQLYLIIANCVFGWLCLWNYLLLRRRMRKMQEVKDEEG